MVKSDHHPGIGMLIIALFLICWGLVWMGNDLGWWSINFPFWPVIVILAGIAILLSQLKRQI